MARRAPTRRVPDVTTARREASASGTSRRDDLTRPRYIISIAAELASCHPRTLRIYEEEGLLKPRRVGQNQLAESGGSRRAENAAGEPIGHEARQQARMIEVRVGEDDRCDGAGVHRQPGPVALAERLEPLEHAAVDENAMCVGLEQVLRPGDGSGRPQEREAGHQPLSILRSTVCSIPPLR